MAFSVAAKAKPLKVGPIKVAINALLTLICCGFTAMSLFMVFCEDQAVMLMPDHNGRVIIIFIGLLMSLWGWDQFLRTWYYAQSLIFDGKIVEYSVYLNVESAWDVEREFNKIDEYSLKSGSRFQLGRRLLRDAGVNTSDYNSEVFEITPIVGRKTAMHKVGKSGEPVRAFNVSVYFSHQG